MTAGEKITQEIIDWYTTEFPTYKGTGIGRPLGEFKETLEWRNGEITLPSGVAKAVESFGGEGLGDRTWFVFDVNGALYRAEGSYTSWDGDDWSYSNIDEVEAVQVMVTKYQKKRV